MWRVFRFFLRLFWRLPWWFKGACVALLPLVALNTAVAFFGNSVVSPLSPFHLKDKWSALGAYASHRPRCALLGHKDVRPLVAEAEARYRLPKGLLQAVIDVESDGRPHRISFAGAMGPAQLMPGTAKQMGVTDPFETEQAIDAAGRFISAQVQRTGDLALAVAAYNAGPGVVKGSIPQNGETEFYVAKVMRRYQQGTVPLPSPQRTSERERQHPRDPG